MKVLRSGIEISDSDIKCLQNDLLNIEDWINEAIQGKINNCKKRLIAEWHPKLIADPDIESIPGDEAGLINFITSHKDYSNRYQREELINAG
jgi:hypothetical protein